MNRRLLRPIAMFMATVMILETIFPLAAYALTGGPSQPEVQTFEPVGSTDMVDLFTGDFSYNIPLLDVGGYPINLSYHSGITMDQEATWVGLGWNINPGGITRDMRGLPDDFKGDEVKKEFNMRNNVTAGVTAGFGGELAGVKKGSGKNIPDTVKLFQFDLDGSLGIYNNNYKGLGIAIGITPALGIGKTETAHGTMSLGLQLDSQNGVDINPSIGFSSKQREEKEYSLSENMNVGLLINSRAGLKSLQSNLTYNSSMGDKKFKWDGSAFLAGSHISFEASAYSPSLTFPFQSESYSFRGTVGGEVGIYHPHGYLDGFYNEQSLNYKSQSNPSFGYFNLDAANNASNALLDFNREKDGPFRESSVSLSIPSGTYDLFSINGEGLGGQFRAYRSDVGIFHDPYVYNGSTGGSLGVEIGLGNTVHGGLDFASNFGISSSGPWENDNLTSAVASFRGIDSVDTYENYCLRNVGDMSPFNHSFFGYWGGEFAVRTDLQQIGKSTTLALPTFNVQFSPGHSGKAIPSIPAKPERDRRSQSISFLTAKEGNTHALDRNILNYPMNALSYNGCQSSNEASIISRLTYPAHHISEITAVNPDGRRYVFGIPAYNMLQKEVVFNVNTSNANLESGNVEYVPNMDNSTDNKLGADYYFDSNTIPQYAHSFLLTAILSSDYQDIDRNGITDNDFGEAIRFNYTLLPYSYKWRLPFAKDSAHYLQGFASVDNDDKGNYEYGEKKIWYVHSIESKNYIAQFIIENRDDSYGVMDENGGIDDSHPLKRLKEIRLYSKEELVKHGNAAVPIKTVHFAYDYSLCPNIPNNKDNGGKLTLKEVWFTYANNAKGRLNSYRFDYNSFNPKYHLKKYDRWGNYQNNDTIPGHPPNRDFPYSLQDTSLANLFSSAWTMTDIRLPSGGKIHVNYESDDYAFVQRERAMQMFIIKGFSKSVSGNVQFFLYDGNQQNNFLKVDLPEEVPNSEVFKKKYLAGISDLYFKCKIDLAHDGKYEWVNGYCGIVSAGLVTNNSNHAYIELKNVDAENLNHPINPITLAGWQFLRSNIPQKAFPGSDPSGAAVSQLLEGLGGMAKEITNMVVGFNSHAESKEWGKFVENNENWVRMRNPGYKKLGGGCRVNQLIISDSWNEMSSGNTTSYGQQFDYTMPFFDGMDTTLISSGVASYEPIAGGDEIPMRLPLSCDAKVKLAPDNDYYIETPLGESLFPAAVVGYRKVTISNITPEEIQRTRTGKSVHEFYTAYDFPVINDFTPINPVRQKHSPLVQLFHFGSEDYMTASQGFTVECNDMYGKPFRTSTYDANNALISSTEYQYKTQNGFGVNMLRNENLPVLNEQGQVGLATIGEDIDIWQDMREEYSLSESVTVPMNVESFILIIPLVLPFIFNGNNFEKTRFRSAATTKYIFRKGIPDKIITTENGSSVTTENLYFDLETGNPVITRTTNEFNDSLYNYSMPAHWVYDGMSGSYKNSSVTIKNVEVSNGKIVAPENAGEFFFPGDEVMITKNEVTDINRYWIAKNEDQLYVLNEQGIGYDGGPVTVKVIKTGRKNMLDDKVGQTVSLNNPVNGYAIAYGYPYCNNQRITRGPGAQGSDCYIPKVISAAANEFKDEWPFNCHIPKSIPTIDGGYVCKDESVNDVINPYYLGILGNWRPWRNHVDDEDRMPLLNVNKTNIRNDGLFRTFNWFWQFDISKNKWERSEDTTAWIRNNEITLYNSRGAEIENKNALDLFSSALYGYLESLPIAVASNARNRSIACDGFEDYTFANSCGDQCYQSHWNFINALDGANVYVTNIASHTGLQSLFVKSNKSAEVIAPVDATPDTGIYYFQNSKYYLAGGACLPAFIPAPGDYILSAWVKEKQACDTATNYVKTSIKLIIDGGAISILTPSGPVIDGWQRYQSKFTIPATAYALHVILKTVGADAYFDDIRIHPFNATMKTFAYNPFNLRLMATLDENNYALFYEYNDEGILTRIKKETERGIATLQENRTHLTGKK